MGPMKQLRNMFKEKRLIATIVMLVRSTHPPLTLSYCYIMYRLLWAYILISFNFIHCLCLLDEQCIFTVIGFQSLNLSFSFKNKLSVVSFHTIWKVWHDHNDEGDREKEHCWLKWLMFQKPAQKSFQESSEDTFYLENVTYTICENLFISFVVGSLVTS